MANWKTTLAGLLAAVAPIAAGAVPAAFHDIVTYAGALALALLGYFANDKK